MEKRIRVSRQKLSEWLINQHEWYTKPDDTIEFVIRDADIFMRSIPSLTSQRYIVHETSQTRQFVMDQELDYLYLTGHEVDLALLIEESFDRLRLAVVLPDFTVSPQKAVAITKKLMNDRTELTRFFWEYIEEKLTALQKLQGRWTEGGVNSLYQDIADTVARLKTEGRTDFFATIADSLNQQLTKHVCDYIDTKKNRDLRGDPLSYYAFRHQNYPDVQSRRKTTDQKLMENSVYTAEQISEPSFRKLQEEAIERELRHNYDRYLHEFNDDFNLKLLRWRGIELLRNMQPRRDDYIERWERAIERFNQRYSPFDGDNPGITNDDVRNRYNDWAKGGVET